MGMEGTKFSVDSRNFGAWVHRKKYFHNIYLFGVVNDMLLFSINLVKRNILI